MKKNLLTLGSLALSLSLSAQVLTYVGNEALVTVQDGALVYSGGGWQNAGSGKVNNTGDIMVVSPTAATNTLFTVADDADFRLKYQDTDTYGQLYISGISQGNITGKVNKEYTADANHSDQLGKLGRQQTALPFAEFSIGDLKAALEPGNANASWLNTTVTTLNYTGRFNVASVFKYSNARARYDQITGADGTIVGNPTDYYIIPRRSQDPTGTTFTEQWNAAVDLRTFKGKPSSDEDANVTVSLTGAAAGINFGVNGNTKNWYQERYNSYIIDPFRVGGGTTGTPAWEADYGKNLYQVANPFLTNVDLFNIGVTETVPTGTVGDGIEINGLIGIATFGAGSVNWTNGVGSEYSVSTNNISAASGGAFQAGDTNLLIKPMSEFYVKMASGASSTSINLKNTRRFAQTSRESGGYDVSGRGVSSSIPSDKIVKQVAVVLKDASGNEVGRTYYAVSPSAVTGGANTELQAYILTYPIYTLEELPTGGEDVSKKGKLYINSANEVDFAGKEIPLKMESLNASTISFEVFEAGARVENSTLSTGKSFYIKKDNTITKINDGASIDFTNGTYGLYYDQPEGFLGSSDLLSSQTIIVKKENDWVVRFSKNWKSADVEVYSAAGQLIHSKKNISTTNDYVIPIGTNVTGLFLVKTTSESGEVVTKKIVK